MTNKLHIRKSENVTRYSYKCGDGDFFNWSEIGMLTNLPQFFMKSIINKFEFRITISDQYPNILERIKEILGDREYKIVGD